MNTQITPATINAIRVMSDMWVLPLNLHATVILSYSPTSTFACADLR